MKISFAIMMHPSREKFLPYLKDKLGDIPVSMDRGISIWDTSKRAWLKYNKTATHHCVIQDDAIIGKDFIKRAEEEIKKHPDIAISFYRGWRRNVTAEMIDEWTKNGGYLTNWLSWGLAVCLPVGHIEAMIKNGEAMPKRYENHDDTKIAKYLTKNKIKVWYPIPSLVDHRTDEVSLIQKTNLPRRKAVSFVGE